MEQKNKRLISYSLIGILLLTFGFYSTTIMYADAISVVNVTFPATSTTKDVDYITEVGSDDTTAFIIGANSTGAKIWKKNSANQIILNYTFSGSTSARAVEYNSGNQFVYAITNDKFWKLTPLLAKVLEVANGEANVARQLIYDETNDILYVCTNDKVYTLDENTLALTLKFNNLGSAGMLGCSLDEANSYMYITGTSVGSISANEIIRVDLSTGTVLNSNGAGANFFFDSCYDSVNQIVWATESSSARVSKFNSDLTLIQNVTVGTTPRYCSISTDDTARRLYVANEGSDTVSIIDIDANVLLASQATCDQGVTTPELDTHRLSNYTNTYMACPTTTNTIIIDDTVSTFEAPPSGQEAFCELPENFNILSCVLARGNTTPLVGASELIGESSNTIVCQLGLIECTNFVPNNPDTKTNGVGYLILFVGLGIMIGIFWVASRGDLGSIPTFLWFIATLSIVGVITAFDLIDATILIVAIIAIIALATAKVKGIFGSSGLFAGDT